MDTAVIDMNKMRDKNITIKTLTVMAFVVLCSSLVFAEDWPMRLRDIRRGGITSEQIKLPLSKVWQHTTLRPPKPAWVEAPAKDDHQQKFSYLKPRQNFDHCFDVAVVDDFLYFGSSNTGAVYCLNTATGQKVWTFFTGGPVRLAPAVAGEKVYVGSDDGYAYCLDAADGSVIWSERVGPSDEMIWGNGRMISVWPVRSSVLVDGEDIFWAAGLFPEEGIYVCKRNAASGKGGWTKTADRPPQGYLLASKDILFLPTGKTYPIIYNRQNGKCIGSMIQVDGGIRSGGSWALLTPEEGHLWFGPSYSQHDGNVANQFNANTKAHIARVSGANYIIADRLYAYYNTDSKIIKINRGDRSVVWEKECVYPYSIIMVGDTIFAGGDGEVAAFNSVDGTRVWSCGVDGKTYGLAAANGAVYVSTDTGSIYCFKSCKK